MASTDSLRRTAPGFDTAQKEQADDRVADLQRVVAMLLEKNEELRQQLIAQPGDRQL